MRIIAGQYRGRRLRTVGSTAVRSTADRVKESLFNILAAELPGANVLDLFCGAGTLGLEALSRGADSAVFVDRLHSSRATTVQNIESVGASSVSKVLLMDALKALNTLTEQGNAFDVIFADPPYGLKWPTKTLTAVAGAGCLADEGVLVIEHHKKDPPGESPEGFSLWTSRRFGDTVFTIWRWSRERSVSEDSDDGA